MDRVGFLIEDSGERIGCLMNPETLEISRTAGLRPRRAAGGVLTGKGLRDDPLLFTGGGTTELKMDLLFDVGLAGSSIQTEDVRDLTGPLVQLAENAVDDEGVGHIRLVRFVWGKAWNIPGVIAALAERFEDFSAEGVPHRSWLRMRFLRVEPPEAPAPRPGTNQSGVTEFPVEGTLEPEPGGLVGIRVHEAVGGSKGPEDEQSSGERLDALAQRAYGDPSLWRWLAAFNRIDNPLAVPEGLVMQIPNVRQEIET